MDEKKLEEMSNEMVDDYYRDGGKYALPLILVAFLLLVGAFIYLNKAKPSKKVVPVTSDDIVEREVEEKYCTSSDEDCIKENIDKGKYYSVSYLEEMEFTKVEYLKEDLEKGKTTNINSSKLLDMEKVMGLEIKSNSTNPYTFMNITLSDNTLKLVILDTNNKEVHTDILNEIDKMYVHKHGYFIEVFLVSKISNLYSVSIDTREYSINKAILNDNYDNYTFKELGLVDLIEMHALEAYKEYELGESSYRYLFKTSGNEYVFVDNHFKYDSNTYVSFSDKLSILKDRSIKVDDVTNGKALLLISSNLRPKYIIDSENYLYNENYETVSKKKVLNVYKRESKDNLSFIVIVFEDGTNIYVNGLI